MSDAMRCRFVWHELMTTDTRSAGSFFSKVVGWKTEAWPNNPSYTLFKAGGQIMAGLMALPEDALAMHVPPNWLSYVGVSNVDDSARKAESLGGKVVKAPSDIPTVGRFAVIQDPQGATLALFTPLAGAPAPTDAAPAIGDFSWHELVTTDWRAALTFYKALFGWEATESMDMGPDMGTYQMFGWKGKTLGGMFNKPAQMPGPPAWLPYIKVKDAKAAAATVKKLGGKIMNGPMEVPGGDLIAQGMDLQGGVFAVHSAKPAAAAKPAASAKPAARKKAPAKKKPAAKAKPAAKKKPVAKKKTAPKKETAPKKKGAKRGRRR
jgi:predicted enzyme related to lactoylglutathione lyase